ncbi:aspartate kinase [Maridesulfovibrio salexigens]|uniref:Aspartokinase n=1 Tax=Maridesulfovibrio salexigens (strain ATCC 14822 / DSM 2638 / NCIMB 8403 / VKM B-1763) TaxID=526222 RepID=C6BV82_MARSD|nr:aspartate kinase [Maridesulfovibrio salexigens]ACS80057.1 aspartate kinase [Maridesulfovibrio salexigens DSM 2638]
MNIVVQKFGGTSVRNLECMKQVLEKVMVPYEKGNKVIVVLSAMAGETNRLIDLAYEWSDTPDLAEMDSLVSTGEQVSVALFSMLLKDRGIKARSLLGFQVPIKTDSAYSRARILDIDRDKIEEMLQENDILVMAGFQGCDEGRRITTLGRGGSDTSAVAMAAAIEADVCEIFTDVPGVFTTDPNICSMARKLDHVSYDEMLEMASMGAKVLQIRSVEFAKKYNVKVHVRSTFSDEIGTYVTQEDKNMESVLVSGIAYDKDQARVTLSKVKDEPGVSAALFTPLAEAGILVDMIVQNPSRDGRTDMTFTIPRGDLKKTLEIIDEIKEPMGAQDVLYDQHVCKVSVIGVGMRNHSGVASKAFQALRDENINILMISTSEIKITCLIEEKYTELAIRTLHNTFGLDKSGSDENSL